MNPASRILAIYDKALQHAEGPDARFIAMWSSVFGIANKNNQPDEDAVSASLLTFRDEIELMRSRLLEKECPPQLFESYLVRVKTIASPTLLPQEWKGTKAGLTPDIRLALDWCAWYLPNEETEISPDEWSALMEELDAVEQSVASSGLSPYVRDFISRQLNLIRTALRHYSIAGITPVEKALEQTYGALTKSRSIIVTEAEKAGPEGKMVLKRFEGVIEGTVKAAEKADKLYKGAKVIASIGSALLKLIS